VFSNGILALSAVAIALVIAFHADVTKLIPFYAIGVFTSFTLSQGGMARRHLRLKEEGWRLGLFVNGVGALTTSVVTIVIAATKFSEGAWAVMIFVPVTVWLLVRMNHLYGREREALTADLPAFEFTVTEPPRVVVVVDALDRAALHALQYARTIRTRRLRAVHVDVDHDATVALVRQWAELRTSVPLDLLPRDGDVPRTLGRYIRGLPDDTEISVVLAAPHDGRRRDRSRRARLASRIGRELLDVERARLTVVNDHPDPGHDASFARLRLAPTRTHRAVVLVDAADRASMRAVRYAMSLGADEVTAVHASADHEREQRLIRRWMELRVPISLDVIECWDRNVPRALEQYVVELTSRRHEVTVVMPRRDYATIRQRMLHDRTSRRIARDVGRYDHVDVAVVPYFFDRRNTAREPFGDAQPLAPAPPDAQDGATGGRSADATATTAGAR
jgi:hypothetical protein